MEEDGIETVIRAKGRGGEKGGEGRGESLRQPEAAVV